MNNKWMNTEFEDDELKPYLETIQDFSDPVRISKYHIKLLALKAFR